MSSSTTSRQTLIRELTEVDEFQACVDIQVAVWGYSDGDVVPRRMFLLAQRIGGQVVGAITDGRIVGFAMAIPGYREGRSYLHSHMLAILPEYRNGGLGQRLKYAQREDAIARGFDHMEWTFDPLEIKNGYLNLARLGAISRVYLPDFYGSSSSPLQGGLPTDRLRAEWWLRSDRVMRVLGGEVAPDAVTDRVEVPREIAEWKRSNHPRAMAAQGHIRHALEDAFRRGLAIVGYDRSREGSGAFLLGAPPPH